jgi:hypothetical protein
MHRGDIVVRVIDPVPLKLDAIELAEDLKPEKLGEELVTLFERVESLIEPKAAYTVTHVNRFEDDLVYLENGHALRGIVLRDMLECGQEIIPYVATIGPKLESEISQERNLLHSFLLEKIGNYALHKACVYLKSFAAKRFGTERPVSEFSPGTGTGALLGIEQQKALFRMLDSTTVSIGVRLTPNLLMVPRKSESGVLAPTRREYVACAYCPRERCESRSTPFVGEYHRVKQA